MEINFAHAAKFPLPLSVVLTSACQQHERGRRRRRVFGMRDANGGNTGLSVISF